MVNGILFTIFFTIIDNVFSKSNLSSTHLKKIVNSHKSQKKIFHKEKKSEVKLDPNKEYQRIKRRVDRSLLKIFQTILPVIIFFPLIFLFIKIINFLCGKILFETFWLFLIPITQVYILDEILKIWKFGKNFNMNQENFKSKNKRSPVMLVLASLFCYYLLNFFINFTLNRFQKLY